VSASSTLSASASRGNASPPKLGAKYLVVAAVLGAFLALLSFVLSRDASWLRATEQPQALLQPILALVGLTGAVWLLMVVYRNLALIRGMTSERYFQTYTLDAPAEWVERPTRAFMNLLEVPVLFYVVCLLMLVSGKVDRVQVALAWLFVGTRYVHALIYIGFNYIPLRFVSYASGVIALGLMWVRLAALSH
jgi:hypothetical protein